MQLPAAGFISPELETFHAKRLFPFSQWSLQHHNLPVKYSIEYELKCSHFSFQPHLTALPPKMELTQVKWLFTHVENEMVLYIYGQMVTLSLLKTKKPMKWTLLSSYCTLLHKRSVMTAHTQKKATNEAQILHSHIPSISFQRDSQSDFLMPIGSHS